MSGTKLTEQQVELILGMLAGATHAERELFIYRCERSGLDPMARQIYPVFRYDRNANRKVMSIQVSIDGYRLIAERTGQYAGQVGPVWYDASGQAHDVWVSDDPPAACRVGVLRKDWSEPLWRSARYQAYVQVGNNGRAAGLWAKMPEVMLAKCAEALALRCAFPEDLSGLYTSDEIDQSEPAADPRRGPESRAALAAGSPGEKPDREEVERLIERIGQLDDPESFVSQALGEMVDPEQLTASQCDKLRQALDDLREAKPAKAEAEDQPAGEVSHRDGDLGARHSSKTEPHPEAAKMSDDMIDGDPDSFDGDRAWEAVIAHISGNGGDPPQTLVNEAQDTFVSTIYDMFAIDEDEMSGRNWFDVAKLSVAQIVPF